MSESKKKLQSSKIQELEKKVIESERETDVVKQGTVKYQLEELYRLNKKISKEIQGFSNENKITNKRSTGSKPRVKEEWKIQRTNTRIL